MVWLILRRTRNFFKKLQNKKHVFSHGPTFLIIILNIKFDSSHTSLFLTFLRFFSWKFSNKLLKPNLYALSKKTKSRIPPSIIHIFYQLKVRFKLDSMHLTIGKFLWPQITPRSELLGLKSYCALKICSLLVKKCPFLVPKIDFYKNSQKFLRW